MNLNVQERALHWKNRPLLVYKNQRTLLLKHYITCNEFNYIKNILQITPYDDTSINCSLTDLTFTNTKIVDKSSRHWSLLLYLKSIAINRHKPTLNHGRKASKDPFNI